MVERNLRLHLLTGLSVLGLVITGAFTWHAAAKAAQRENRMFERVRPVCAHNGFNNEEVHRLVRFAYGSWPTREDAVHAVIVLCRGDA
jgi:hypothetical protein